ncbi:FAD-dependent oxidoreductase [Christensenellaceae bacterium NSJ-63]|uniref:FAD-dependent oxidoreductase n=1 Tax=Guopingia tenuis TaxID=2763656 RepID=A0A926HVH5_9FIRM|nr:FAD-dependent oxidoreductase [Guopingia tenuis]MBC8537964.1 FAD-dependent oxidoreductase [Guopingia tenuis]
MESLWSKTASLPEFPVPPGDRKTDVLIIGGGIAGLLLAYELQKAGVEYMLVEASEICSGITKNTTAKITSQHGLCYTKLAKRLGDGAGLYLRANQEALEEFRNIARRVPCDFQEKDAFVYTLSSPEKIRQEAENLRKLGFPAKIVHELPLPLPIQNALCFPKQAQFHPLKFAAGIAPGLHIYTHTKALEFLNDGHLIQTNRGRISAKKVVVATHFPMNNKHGGYFLKLYQDRSYVLALENAPDMEGMYIDESPQGYSFRNIGNLLLLGGGGHRTGKSGDGWRDLEAFARKEFPGAAVQARWAAQDCMSLDGAPYIGPYSRHTPDFFVATGFNKWGMTSSMAAALLLVDLVQGKENPYAPVFSPSRSILHPQLFVNTWEALSSLLRLKRPRCPHMGCALQWNSAEQTWDCPCHGSRFDAQGRLIDNPATDGLQTK